MDIGFPLDLVIDILIEQCDFPTILTLSKVNGEIRNKKEIRRCIYVSRILDQTKLFEIFLCYQATTYNKHVLILECKCTGFLCKFYRCRNKPRIFIEDGGWYLEVYGCRDVELENTDKYNITTINMESMLKYVYVYNLWRIKKASQNAIKTLKFGDVERLKQDYEKYKHYYALYWNWSMIPKNKMEVVKSSYNEQYLMGCEGQAQPPPRLMLIEHLEKLYKIGNPRESKY